MQTIIETFNFAYGTKKTEKEEEVEDGDERCHRNDPVKYVSDFIGMDKVAITPYTVKSLFRR